MSSLYGKYLDNREIFESYTDFLNENINFYKNAIKIFKKSIKNNNSKNISMDIIYILLPLLKEKLKEYRSEM
jgi:hypothetical protein